MKYTFGHLLVLIICFACVRYKASDPTPVNNLSPKTTTNPIDSVTANKMSKIKYLALGDSYTYGQSVDTDKRFPALLIQSLKDQGFSMDTLQMIARTGWTTGELQTVINEQKPDSNFGMVTLLIGVNNKFRGYSLDDYKVEFDSLLNQAIHFAGGNKNHVFVVSIPDYGYTPYGEQYQQNISIGIDAFNEANKEITVSKGITYFDITPISRNGLLEPDLVADDGLHPSAKMYALWVQLMLPQVVEQLKK